MWTQRQITLEPRGRGFHLVTDELAGELPEIGDLSVGMLWLQILHTSASLALNENAAPEVRTDLESWFTEVIPEGGGRWRHDSEGPDDMPAHVKSVLIGSSLSVPISDGRLLLGTWQGVYLCEHRDRASGRTIAATLNGEPR